MTHSKLVPQYNRKDPKTDNVAERVDLNPKRLIILGTVLFGSGDLAIEHIA